MSEKSVLIVFELSDKNRIDDIVIELINIGYRVGWESIDMNYRYRLPNNSLWKHECDTDVALYEFNTIIRNFNRANECDITVISFLTLYFYPDYKFYPKVELLEGKVENNEDKDEFDIH